MISAKRGMQFAILYKIKKKGFMKTQKHITLLIILTMAISSLMLNNCYQIENEVNNNLVWCDTFDSNDLTGWEVIDEVDGEESNWFVEKGYLIQDTDFGKTKTLNGTDIIKSDKEFKDCVLRANMACTDDDFIGVLFRYNDVNNYYRFLLSSQRKIVGVDKKVNGEFITLATYTEKEWPYVKFSVTVFMEGNNIKVYLNDELFFDIKDKSFARGKVGFTSISNLGSFFDDISIYSEYKIQPVETKQEIVRGPYLQNVLENHAVIMWNTLLPNNSVVEYGITKEDTQTITINEGLINHEVRLDDLKQETVYFYRINSNNVTSEWYSFKTASSNKTNFSFVAYGDTQMNFLRHAEVVEQMVKHDFDFIVHVGDVVQRGPRDDWDVEFFGPMKEILTNKPVYAAIGNHELNSENYYKYFNNPAPEHESYYSFQYGNSFFVVIDNAKEYAPEREYYTEYERGSEQYIWLEKELSSREAQDAEWLFVLSHVPIYIPGKEDPFVGCVENLLPLFEKYDVDVSFSGHLHGYARNEFNGVTYVITAGGGGAQNKNGSSEKLKYKEFQLAYNFSHVTIDGKKLLLNTYNNKGDLIDETEICH